MTVEAPMPGIGRRSSRWAGRPRLSWAQLNWLLRLAELPAVLVLVALGRPDSNIGLLVGLLSVASGAWITWLGVRSWNSEFPADGPVVLALLVIIAATSGLAAMIPGAGNAAILAAVVALEAGTTLNTGKPVAVALAGVAGAASGSVLFAGPDAGIWVAFYAAVFAGAALAGVARGLRREQLRQATALLARERQARAEQQRAAALAERTRIAREIHDILAHSLADLSIQLEVADALLTDTADVPGALRHVRHAHRLAGDGLDETRRAISALRSDSPPLPDALAVMAGAHGHADVRMEGSPRPLSAAAGLALIRAAQEALVNARTHAADLPVTIHLRYGADRVELTVIDTQVPVPEPRGPAPDQHPRLTTPASEGVGGYGLAGMRERLRLVGGSLTAGPVPGGWVVHAEVPG